MSPDDPAARRPCCVNGCPYPALNDRPFCRAHVGWWCQTCSEPDPVTSPAVTRCDRPYGCHKRLCAKCAATHACAPPPPPPPPPPEVRWRDVAGEVDCRPSVAFGTARYVAVLAHGGGCDYTIGCGVKIVPLGASSRVAAEAEAFAAAEECTARTESVAVLTMTITILTLDRDAQPVVYTAAAVKRAVAERQARLDAPAAAAKAAADEAAAKERRRAEYERLRAEFDPPA